jgi:hypothetical protein
LFPIKANDFHGVPRCLGSELGRERKREKILGEREKKRKEEITRKGKKRKERALTWINFCSKKFCKASREF